MEKLKCYGESVFGCDGYIESYCTYENKLILAQVSRVFTELSVFLYLREGVEGLGGWIGCTK